MNQTYKAINLQYLEGCITAGYLYAPFGEILQEHLAVDNRIPKYAFNAKELDEENGMYYYSARYYAPPTFISRDPMFEKYPSISPYTYCANNPMKFIDPDGREKIKSLSTKDTRNATINAAADNYPENKPVIHVWAHGSDQGVRVVAREQTNETPEEVATISTPEGFNQFLLANSDIWLNNEDNKNIIIVLHSCKTGKGESSFAEKLSNSELFKDVLIVAPNNNVSIDDATLQEIGVDGERGAWRFFRNGKQVDAIKGDSKPIFDNPKKINEKYEDKEEQ